ncbi:MAG: aldose 1-epimerase [Acidobacteriota bacterium]
MTARTLQIPLLLMTLLTNVPELGSYTRSEATRCTYRIETDSRTNWEIYVLTCSQPSEPSRSLEARISPEAGNNLFSLKIGETELLEQPAELSGLPGVRYGIPILFPTPNRVRESRFVFAGRSFSFPANERTHFIHGLVHSAKWQADSPTVTPDGVVLNTWLDWNASLATFSLFPIRHRLTVSYLLKPEGVRIGFAVLNLEETPLPFGFGLHPYFRILGQRSETRLFVQAQKHMQAEGRLPTGVLEELDGTRYDLRAPASLDALDLDDVYWGMSPSRLASYESVDGGICLSLRASQAFTHMVVYTPRGRPFFCLENQTCSTDAHNLHSRGLSRESHLLVANKGSPVAGWVELKVERIR